MLAGGAAGLVHAIVTIHFQADQIVSGLALTFLGTGLALVLGEGLAGGTGAPGCPPSRCRCCRPSPSSARSSSPTNGAGLRGYLLVPLTWYWINRTRPGLHLRAVGEAPSAADALGVSVYRLRYVYTFLGGALAGLAGATICMAISPAGSPTRRPGSAGSRRARDLRPVESLRARSGRSSSSRSSGGCSTCRDRRSSASRTRSLPAVRRSSWTCCPTRWSSWWCSSAPRGSARVGAPAALGVPYVRGERGL